MGKLGTMLDYGLIRLLSLLPLKNDCVVLKSLPDYSDNARAFSDFLQACPEAGIRAVWLVKDPNKYRGSANVRFVSSAGKGIQFRRDYYLAVSRFVVYTHSAPIRMWRKRQVFIHTTHSASQLKGGDIRKADDKRTVIPDYRLRCGRDGLERMMRTSGLPEEKFAVLGMPRLDVLYRHRDCITPLFHRPKPRLTAIAMETFKQSHGGWKDSDAGKSYGLNILPSREALAGLDAFLNQRDILLLIKPHPLQDLSYIEMESLENIRFITDAMLSQADIQLYELLENCDALLTDYSSVYYDYLLLDRPIGFLIGDMEDYRRGFVIPNPLDEMTGPKLKTPEELEGFFDDVLAGRDGYVQARAELRDRVFQYQDDKNCERLLAFIHRLQNN